VAPVQASGSLRSINLSGIEISCRISGSVSYALYHCRIPVIGDLTITNVSHENSNPFTLSLAVPGYSDVWQSTIKALPPGGTLRMDRVPLGLKYEILEGLEGRRYADLVVDVDGARVHTEEILVLGFYEWPLDPAVRKSLACFVQPSHPLVYQIIADADRRRDSFGGEPALDKVLDGSSGNVAGAAMQVLYNTLSGAYNVRYTREAPSYELDSQVVRPPHRLITSPRRKTGAGTCIDLALLLASCLENLNLQPLVLVVRQGDSQRRLHALVGCWSQVGQRFEPVVTDFEVLEKALQRDRLSVIDPTGLTTRWGAKLSYDEARRLGNGSLRAEDFVFALDVAAARQTVTPLQLPVSPGAIQIIRLAERLARSERSERLETKHLLRALVHGGREDVRTLLTASGATLDAPPVPDGAGPSEAGMFRRATINYRRCLDDARLVAADSGVGFVEEEHLLYALLLSQSQEVDRVLRALGTERSTVIRLFVSRYPWTLDVEQTICESTGRPTAER
jgi:hypothetical protein